MSSTARSPLPDSCCWTENALPPPHRGCVAGSGGLLCSPPSAETALLSASGLLVPVGLLDPVRPARPYGPAHPRQTCSSPSDLLVPVGLLDPVGPALPRRARSFPLGLLVCIRCSCWPRVWGQCEASGQGCDDLLLPQGQKDLSAAQPPGKESSPEWTTRRQASSLLWS